MKSPKFSMTDGEISNDFRLAKNKREMVEILADQNLVSPGAMARKLDELGLMEDAGLNPDTFSNTRSLPQGLTPRNPGPKPKPKAPPKSNDRPTVPPIDEIRAMELWKEGADDIAMSEALGVPITRVKEWRYRMHLLRPLGGAMKKKKEAELLENVMTPEASAEVRETPGASPTCCQPARETAVDESELDTPNEEAINPGAEPERMTLARFMTALAGSLTTAVIEASELQINGAPVREIAQIIIKSTGSGSCVNIVTEG